ncbi:helix-turn-helix domain-containing protein [Roseibium sp.]|uniref:helix-turn-helix domain-containing protein n=1 Tax=Roseibium sp. TaxID=1936156 RepID=UPI003B5201B0
MQKNLYSGHTLRQIRADTGLSQVEFAKKLGLSTPYINQIENNNRPITASVLLAIHRIFGTDLAAFEDNDLDRMTQDLEEIFTDTRFHGTRISKQDLHELVTRAPEAAKAIMDMYGTMRAYHEKDAGEDDLLQMNASDDGTGSIAKSAYEEVRDYFHYQDNYVDAIDRAAEQLAHQINLTADTPKLTALTDWLFETYDITVEQHGAEDAALIRHSDFDRRISIHRAVPDSSKSFLLGTVIAELHAKDKLTSEVKAARFRTQSADSISRLALRNYFAGSLLLPYDAFLDAASACRHDTQRLSHQMDASIEQICHRLSTLQRSGSKGIPFYFVKIDRAGNVVKRHSATRFQFARFGGSCPRWNVHQAFEQTTDKFISQIAQMPDGVKYLCVATSVTKHTADYKTQARRYALGFGCEAQYADAIVYADGLAMDERSVPEPLGVNCRICPRDNCDQRAFPAINTTPFIDSRERGVVPYQAKAAR